MWCCNTQVLGIDSADDNSARCICYMAISHNIDNTMHLIHRSVQPLLRMLFEGNVAPGSSMININRMVVAQLAAAWIGDELKCIGLVLPPTWWRNINREMPNICPCRHRYSEWPHTAHKHANSGFCSHVRYRFRCNRQTTVC